MVMQIPVANMIPSTGQSYQYAYIQDPGLSQQMGQMSLQDPAYIKTGVGPGVGQQQISGLPAALQPGGGHPTVLLAGGGHPGGGLLAGQVTSAALPQPPFSMPPMAGGSQVPGSIPMLGQFQGNMPGVAGMPGMPKVRSHDEVGELGAEEVRWFYKNPVEKTWIAFDGYDSLRIEIRYRHIWQTRWTGNKVTQRRARSLNRYYDGSGTDSYSGDSDEYAFSDSAQYLDEFRNRDYFHSDPKGRRVPSRQNHKNGRLSKRLHYRTDELLREEKEFTIVVRGGIYLVDLNQWKCNSIYWPSTGLEIMRGTWFHDQSWQPLDCEHADRIEAEHIKKFMGHKMSDYVWDVRTSTRKDVMVHHVMQFPGEYRVEWMSPEETYMHLESTGSKIYRGLVESLGSKKSTGYRIFRGYSQLCNAAERLPDVSHIVFVVHGVGGIMDESTIGRNATLLRDNISQIMSKCFPKFMEQSGQRVEFFPVEWRNHLRLDQGLVDAITPQRIGGLRSLLNSTAMDIMYYTSPLYRMEIWNALQTELNRLYVMFTERHPNFETNGGKVSIVSHSLGCVITYDVLSGWTQDVEYAWYSHQVGPTGVPINPRMPRKPPDSGSGLLFRIENFFCLGSPLPVFLSLRWRDPTNTELHEHILPRHLVKYLYNIYHPCDPVAYRIEPIFMKIYSEIEPLHIYNFNQTDKMPYHSLPLQPVKRDPPGQEGLPTGLPVNIVNGAINIDMGRMASGVAAGLQAPAAGAQQQDPAQQQQQAANSQGFWNMMRSAATGANPTGQPVAGVQQPDQMNGHMNGMGYGPELRLPDGKRLAYRMDYVVKESGNSYIAAVTSHTSYWCNKDIAFFILTKLFPELENVPLPPNIQ